MQAMLSKNRTIILVCAVLCQGICNFPSTWAVFQPYVAAEYGYTLDASALVMPLCVVFFGVMSIIGGRVVDVLSTRVAAWIGCTLIAISFINAYWIPAGKPIFMYIGFSFFFGGGCGFFFSTMYACTMKWYADRKGFAGGVTGCVAGLYIVGFTYVSEYLLSSFGVRNTFAIVGIASVVVGIMISFVFVNPTPEYIAEKTALAGESAKGKRKNQIQVVDFKTNEMLRTKQYYFLIASIMLIMPAYMLLSPSIVSIGIGKGLTKQAALAMLSTAAACTAVGRLVMPWVSDYIGRKRTIVISWVAVAILSLAFMNVGNGLVVLVYAMLSFFYSGGFAIIGPTSTELFGYKYAGTNMGFVNISNSIGSLLGPMLLTVAVPILGENARSFIGIGGAVLAAIFMMLINVDMAKTKQKLEKKKLGN